MTHYQQLARQPLRAWARLHADDRAGSALEEGERCLTAELNALDYRAAIVETNDVEYIP